MTVFNHSTRRRLQNLPQIPSVWEGDRRLLSADPMMGMESDGEGKRDCVLWVDGTQGVVRAMDLVAAETGPEAVVRILLRAMEYPHSPGRPSRPQKIVVKDREIQFFLRGVLQELEIAIEYAPDLPVIDEIFRGFEDLRSSRPPQLPPQYEKALFQVSRSIWADAPWDFLEEHQVITVELNQWDINTLYASVMGMLGMEYGILLYRSLDSLKQFRQKVLADESFDRMEEAFLQQDCLFLNYETLDEAVPMEDAEIDLATLDASEIRPSFGNLHPLEGLRSVLHEEEAAAAFVALEALHRFFCQHRRKLSGDSFPALRSRYRIPVLIPDGDMQKVSIGVATVPELATELFEMVEVAAEDSVERSDVFSPFHSLHNDLIPANSFLSLGAVPWDVVEALRTDVKYHQPGKESTIGDELPVILIQTTRPKAQSVIQTIQEAGGLRGIAFNPGEDSLGETRYDLGILQTVDGNLHLFGEFEEDDPTHIEDRRKWDQRCKRTRGCCGLVIAMGLTGMSRGQPTLKDMMALFEVRSLSSQDLGLGKLQLVTQARF